MILTRSELAQIREQAEAEYPSECCGVIVARNGSPGDRRLLACRNVQNDLHARDPVRYPRDARTAFNIDPRDLLRIGSLEDDGYHVQIIYHSHIDAGAYFSETDKKNALIQDEPTYPDAAYLVVSVVAGQAAATAAFRWNPNRRDFLPVEIQEP